MPMDNIRKDYLRTVRHWTVVCLTGIPLAGLSSSTFAQRYSFKLHSGS